MQQMAVSFGDIPVQEISYIVTDEDSVKRFNIEFMSEGFVYEAFIFLKNGVVYGSDFCEPMSNDKVWRVK